MAAGAGSEQLDQQAGRVIARLLSAQRRTLLAPRQMLVAVGKQGPTPSGAQEIVEFSERGSLGAGSLFAARLRV
jgi:hypothetical protein